MITSDLVQRRLNIFWGYGSLDAPTWFVGMEEGLTSIDISELEIRFQATDGKIMADIRNDMTALSSHMKWFRPPFPLQYTWRYIINFYLCLVNDRRPSTEEVREYQRGVLGNLKLQQSAVIELMPLPSNTADESGWLYADYNVVEGSSRCPR